MFKVTATVQHFSINDLSDYILCTAEPFVTKHGKYMHHHEP